uniref:C2H2-type domain-containing protein n=1 Tax=Heterorhabditis bacteriophora TaxID=37862 RepID=A0A1I7X1B5_HETBA
MELFLPHLQSLRYHFKYLSSDEQDTALGMVLSAVQHMREDSVCRRIHCEAERSLADETEKMIFVCSIYCYRCVKRLLLVCLLRYNHIISEKFSGDWLPLSHCSSPRFSWDLKDGIGYSCKQSMLFDSMGTLENDSQTAKKRDGNCTSELISSINFHVRSRQIWEEKILVVNFIICSHRCGQCDKIFKDSCTLKGHLKWHARKLHDS